MVVGKNKGKENKMSEYEPSGYVKIFHDDEPCNHIGCRNHITHPCELCGRVESRGISIIPIEKLNKYQKEKEYENPDICPRCQSFDTNIEREGLEDGMFIVGRYCDNCDCYWDEIFQIKLKEIKIIE